MAVVHFTTELSGGAGGFVRNLHVAMQELGLPSLVFTRVRSELANTKTIKPMSRVAGSLRARYLGILGKLSVINTSYAMFGIERNPVGVDDIKYALEAHVPTAFIFYWISYFVSFETIFKLRRAYPNVPFIFVCTDEAFLTGGCHYSNGCVAYMDDCRNCPAASLTQIKKKISQGFRHRQEMISAINPFIIYPTSNIAKMGRRSAVFKNVPSSIIPLGVVSNNEMDLVAGSVYRTGQFSRGTKRKLRLLVRSSSEYRKGCDLFVAAIKMLSEKIPNLRDFLEVVSIGDNTLKTAQIEKYLDHVVMGYVGREELMSIYKRIDAFIVNSREDGGPLMINECVALGIFVISTPIGVANDLIVHKQNGLITKDISEDAIYDALIELLDQHRNACLELAHTPVTRIQRTSLTFEGYITTVMNLVKSESLFRSNTIALRG